MNDAQKCVMLEDVELLKTSDLKDALGNCIGGGSYGFVMEYQKDKAVKVFEEDYIRAGFQNNGDSGTPTPSLWDCANAEILTTDQLSFTKSSYLMSVPEELEDLPAGGKEFSFLVMPRMTTLCDLAVEEGRKEQQIASILADCFEGLLTLHRQTERPTEFEALVHCDIKPSNIFISPKKENEQRHFLLGDYSIAQSVRQLERQPRCAPPCENPYMAPGTLDRSSDLYSLGWVLYWWMNGKIDPTAEETAARKKGTLKMPDCWGDNQELWALYLKMTEPVPENRLQSAEAAKKALNEALEAKAERLKGEMGIQRYRDGKNEGEATTAAAAVALYLAATAYSKLARKTPITDGQGRLHGKVPKKQPYCGGYFQGTWENGEPREGTFTFNGSKKYSSAWQVCPDSTKPFLSRATHTASGLCYTEKGQCLLYQGQIEIKWPWGTTVSIAWMAGTMERCGITFSDGTQIPEKVFSLKKTDSFTGFCVENENGTYTGCGQFTVGPVTVECEFRENLCGAGVIILPDGKEIRHTDPNYEKVTDLLLAMKRQGQHFQGTWSEDGLPLTGYLVFSTGDQLAGRWEYDDNYGEPFMKTGQACFTGFRFIDNSGKSFFQGKLQVKWSSGTRFFCDMKAGEITNGVMTFSDGHEEPGNYDYRCVEELGLTGLLRKNKDGSFTGCAQLAVGPDALIECEWNHNSEGAGVIFLPGENEKPREIYHTSDSYQNALELLIAMHNCGGSFHGVWYEEGVPKEGIYTFRDGRQITGQFSFVAGIPYHKKAVYSGMFSGGKIWGAGCLRYSNGQQTDGEFWDGKYLK